MVYKRTLLETNSLKKGIKKCKCDLCYRARFFVNLSLLHKLEKINYEEIKLYTALRVTIYFYFRI